MGKLLVQSKSLKNGDVYVNEFDEKFVIDEVSIHRNVGPDSQTMVAMRLRPHGAEESPGLRDAWDAERWVHILQVPEIHRPSRS